MQEIIKGKEPLKVGDKVYSVCMEKTIVLFQIGKENIETGLNILGAHIDSPRIDVKQNPLYEAGEFAYLDTHYYGGIKNTSGWHCRWRYMVLWYAKMVQNRKL